MTIGPIAVRCSLAVAIFSIAVVSFPSTSTAQQFQTARTYAVKKNPLRAATGDFNNDGHPDLAVTIGGTGQGGGKMISVLLANANGTFQTAVNYPTVGTVGGIVASDFNHDGKIDLATSGSQGVNVFLGNGDGTFQAAVDFGSSSFPSYLVSGDFDGDGKIDIVTSGSGQAHFMKGNGDGTFQSPTLILSGGTTYFELVTADFNHDGKLDLVSTINQSSGDVSIFLGNGNGTFQSSVNYPVGAFPSGLAVADFDGDGKPDVAVAECFNKITCIGHGNIAILLGNGDGTLKPPQTFVGVTESTTSTLLAADFNGDGKVDLAVTSGSSDDVVVLLGNGNGTIRHGVTWAAGLGSIYLVTEDFNHDGIPDLATVNVSGNNVSVLLGTANGNFTAARDFTANTQPRAVAAGDFNGDGNIDLAVTDNSSGSVNILLGLGRGTFGAPIQYAASGTQTNQVAVADLNGDHHPDLVVVANSGTAPISVLIGNGDGTFKPPVNYAAGNVPQSVAIADFNGDGRPDLAVANNGSSVFGNVSLFLGNGDGTFQTPTTISVGNNYPYWITAGDFNNDGKPDLALVYGADPGSLSVLLGNGNGTFQPPSTPVALQANPVFVTAADLNADGKLDVVVTHTLNANNVDVVLGKGDGTFQAPVNYPAGKQPTVAGIADFNGDGIPDIVISSTGADGNGAGLTLLLGTGGGGFRRGTPTVAGAVPYGLAIADFNGDGKTDVAVSNILGNNITILLNAQR